MAFQILSHTADVRILATGKTLEELFASALLGMGEILKSGACEKNKQLKLSKEISISSVDPTTLLVDFLSKVLTLSHINLTIFCKINFVKLKENSLKARLFGQKIDSFDNDIKAVSYSEAEITKDKDGNFQTVIIFDI